MGLALTAAGCGLHAQKTTEVMPPPSVVVSSEPEPSTGCKVAGDPCNPFIVEWPAAERTNLESQSQAGLVVVSYAGCTLKVRGDAGRRRPVDCPPGR